MGISLEIVSPEKLLLSRPVDMVVIPASEGDMGVLAGHAPLVTALRPGIIVVYRDAGDMTSVRVHSASRNAPS